jgi:hypothetical protein
MFSMLTFMLLSLIEPSLASRNGSEQIRIVPVKRTPEAKSVVLAIAVPKDGVLVHDNPVWVQFRLDGYALGVGSQFDRRHEVGVSRDGQTVHAIIDNDPYIAVDEPAIDPFKEDGWYYDVSYKFEIPHRLKEGLHTIRMFPARSYGESLKGDSTFQSAYFYVGRKAGDGASVLNEPYLTYNEPSDQIPLTEDKPALLDFYITNCELSTDGYRVQLTVDNSMKRTLTSWQPYYIYGMKRGKHTIRLQLLDPRGNVVKGPFNDVERTIYVGS